MKQTVYNIRSSLAVGGKRSRRSHTTRKLAFLPNSTRLNTVLIQIMSTQYRIALRYVMCDFQNISRFDSPIELPVFELWKG